VSDGSVASALLPQALREPGSRSHVRAGLEDRPELAGAVFEDVRTEVALRGSDSGFVQLPLSADVGVGILSQQDIRIRAIRIHLEGGLREVDSILWITGLPRLVHHLLGNRRGLLHHRLPDPSVARSLLRASDIEAATSSLHRSRYA
jgi:hypothetical protein